MAAPQWVITYLNRANVINTPPVQTFLEQWASNEGGSCRNNHLDLSTAVAGSTRCGDTVAGFGRTQNYATLAEAAHAFSIQVHTSWVKPLLDALNTGNPFQIGDRSAVVTVLERWGSPTFAAWYATASSSGGGGGGGGGSGTGLHKAWGDVRRSLNKRAPASLNDSSRHIGAALRSIRHARKVVG